MAFFYRQFTYKNQQRHSTTLTYIFIFSKGRQVESVSIMTTLIKHCRLIHYSIWLWKRWQVLTQSHSLLPLSLYCFLTVLLFPYYLCGQKLKPIHQVIITVSPLHSTPIINYTSTLMNSIKKIDPVRKCVGHHCHQLPSMALIIVADIRRAKPQASFLFLFYLSLILFYVPSIPLLVDSAINSAGNSREPVWWTKLCFWQFKHSSSHNRWS